MFENCIAIDIKEFIAVVGYNKDKVIDLAGKLEKKHRSEEHTSELQSQ